MDWRSRRNLLCVRLGGVGGVLRSAADFLELKQARPGRRVTLLASPAGVEAAAGLAGIDQGIAYRAPWLTGPVPATAVADLGMRYALGLHGFDGAVILDGACEPSAQLCAAAGIEVLHFVRDLHAPRPDYRIAPAARSRARLKLEEAGIDLRAPYLVVHPVGEERWPAEHFAEAARQLSLALDQQVVVTGRTCERDACRQVRRGSGPRASCLAGHLSFAELAATLSGATFALGNRTAPMELARMVGTATVEIGGTPAGSGGAHRCCRSEASVADVVREACDLWLDIHWRAAA